MAGKLKESAEERGKFYELPTKVGTKKSQFQISKNTKGRNLIEKKPKNNHEVKEDVKKIQKAVSCVFQNTSDSKQNEKTKKSDSERGKYAIGSKQKKKNKSLDHLEQNTSKESLAQRVTDVLQGAAKKGRTSELDLSLKGEEVINKGTVNNQTMFKDNSKKKWNNKQLPAQSLSFEYLELTKKEKELCKSISLETGTDKQHDRRAGITEQFKGNFVCKPDAMLKHDQTHSKQAWPAYSSELLNQAPSNQLVFRPDWRYTFKPTPPGIERVRKKSSEILRNSSFESVKGQSKENQSRVGGTKDNIKICHCPHFHGEGGMKKICLQDSPTTEEYGRKFFRVNYISKEKVDKVYIDKGTTTEDEVEKKKLKTKAVEKNKTNKMRTQKTKEDNLQTNPKSTISSIKKYVQGLENSKKNKRKETKGDTSAAKEVERLRQLFIKLNSIERVLKKEKHSESSKGKPRHFLDIPVKDAEKEIQDDISKNLKSKILQHLNAWLALEYKYA